MSSVRDLDRRSVYSGVIVDLVLTLPAGFINAALDEGSNLTFLFTLIVLAAPFLAGAVAARRHPRTSLLHGATAAGIGWAVAIAITAVAKLIAGDGVPVLAMVVLGVWSVSMGTIGGYVEFRRELRQA